MSEFDLALARLRDKYNANAYDAATNPGGMGKGGHRENLVPAFRDMALVGGDVADKAAMAAAAASQEGAWKQVEGAAVARVSDTELTVAGDVAWLFKPNRAVKLTQTNSGFGWAVSSAYDAETGLTAVTLYGVAVDAGLSEVWYGQDPACAPKPVEAPSPVPIIMALRGAQ